MTHEGYLYWDSVAVLCRVILAHTWLSSVHAMARKTRCPVVCGLEGLSPLSSQTCAENRCKEEQGHILRGKDKTQILQAYFRVFFKISIWFSSIFIVVSSCAGPSWPALLRPGDIQRRVAFSAATHPAKRRMRLARSQPCNISDNFLLPVKFVESVSKLICQKHQRCSDNCFNFI